MHLLAALMLLAHVVVVAGDSGLLPQTEQRGQSVCLFNRDAIWGLIS